MSRDQLTLAAVVLALVGFASNSLLCRAALATGAIDASTFTAIRIVAGAVVLAAIVLVRTIVGVAHVRISDAPEPETRGSWLSAIALFAYAIAFSFAYLRLVAATGALILFASVQVTMFGVGIARGERPRVLEWIGSLVAFGGLVGLVAPGLAAPDPLGAALMAIAGVSWGVYTLRGRGPRGTRDALAITANNFARAIPLAVVALVIAGLVEGVAATDRGVWLAIASGALASGIGYSLWYAALPYVPAILAAIVQLAVPVLTALAAVLLLDESLTLRLLVASAAIIGGIAIAVTARAR